jgi:membrane-associated phospholipid phosphatase
MEQLKALTFPGSLTQNGLPLVINPRNKIWLGIVLFAFAAVLYVVSNRYHFFPAQLLPMTSFDHAIPFIPQTVWIYTSEYIFFIVTYLMCKNVINLNKYTYSMITLQIISVVIFLVWPTTYPRELFPLPEGLDRFTHWVFSSLRAGDTPDNCCPSLHCSSVFLCSFLFLQEQRKKFPLMFGWALAIALSTLTTKQHYIIDVVAGLGMALLLHRAFYQWLRYRNEG